MAANRAQLLAAEATQKNPQTWSRVLDIDASSPNDGTCPGEMSKTFRLRNIVAEALAFSYIETDLLDLGLLTFEYKLQIRPCRGCAPTDMPLCHRPCSCCPRHSLVCADGGNPDPTSTSGKNAEKAKNLKLTE